MTTQYIELDRRFSPYEPGPTSEDDGRYRIWTITDHGLAWDDVLKTRITVIFAEGGMGKTTELLSKSARLLQTSVPAFYCALDMLASMPLAECLTVGHGHLEDWLQSDQQGFFFLDSVDETKLGDVKAYERALLKFRNALGPATSRATLVLSTSPRMDRRGRPQHTANALGIDQTQNQVAAAAASSDQEDASGTTTIQTERVKSWQYVQLLPLSEAQVRHFVSAKGVTDIDAFIAAVESADALKFAVRPADLPGLIRLWQSKKGFGTYSNVLAANIEQKFTEENQSYAAVALPFGRLQEGAERLAAAMTLTRKLAIGTTASNPDVVNPRQVLDWDAGDVIILLSKPIFDEAIYNAVRFHHRSVREYLTAAWLKRQIDAGRTQRDVRNLLSGRPYSDGELTVLPYLRPVAGWLTTMDLDFRDWLIKVDPTVILEHGDSAVLPAETRARLLRTLAAKYRDRVELPLRMDPYDVRRLAHRGLADVVRELLGESTGHADLQHLLLRVIRIGGLPGFGALCSALAQDPTANPTSRSYAIGAMRSATPKERDALKQSLSRGDIFKHRQMCGDLLDMLRETTQLAIDDVRAIITNVTAAREFSADILTVRLTEIAQSATASDTLQHLASVTDLMGQGPFLPSGLISKRHAWLGQFLYDLVSSALAANPVAPFDERLLRGLVFLDRLKRSGRYIQAKWDRILAVVRANRPLTHAFLWYCVAMLRAEAKAVDGNVRYHWAFLQGLDAGDVDRLEAAFHERTPPDKELAIQLICAIALRTDRKDELFARTRNLAGADAALLANIAGYEKPYEPSEIEKRFHEDNKKRRSSGLRLACHTHSRG